MSEYGAVYFVGDNQAINRVRIDSSKTRNQGGFSGSLAALNKTIVWFFGIISLLLSSASQQGVKL